MRDRLYLSHLPNDTTSIDNFLRFFESLNELALIDFLEDVLYEKINAVAYLGFPVNEEPHTYLTSFLRMLSPSTKYSIRQALQKIIISAIDKNFIHALEKCFYILRSLKLEIDKALLKEITSKPTFTPNIRFSAAMILAEDERFQNSIFWLSLDLEEFPELMVPSLYSISKHDPSKCIFLLNKWNDNRFVNYNSVDIAIKRLIGFSKNREQLISILKDAKPWVFNLLISRIQDPILKSALGDAILNMPDYDRILKLIKLNHKIINVESYPNVFEIQTSKIIHIEKGTYLNSIQNRITAFDSLWLSNYTKNVISIFQNTFGVQITEHYSSPVEHNYPYLVERIKFSTPKIRHINLPLEMLFEHNERKNKINIMPLFNSTHFAILYNVQYEQDLKLNVVPDEEAIFTYSDWLKHIKKIKINNQSIKLCTQSDTSVQYELTDASALGLLMQDQITEVKSANQLKDWLIIFGGIGIVVCDVGVAIQTQMLLNSEYHNSNYHISYIPYKEPIKVGLAFRNDDIIWRNICQGAFAKTSKLLNTKLRKDWQNTLKIAEVLKLKAFYNFMKVA